ncbi:kinase-like domain-containing protein [Rhodocollybia butyracea]|uniref:Kinase-like domain-containing protein n=1 Tax=Rhodocollybia butyracea TaxID=206335 RepID=A0A9P5Q225_9AGAR|nr:kinase-like domain-containing protein [Rhodocollybia butyracea]
MSSILNRLEGLVAKIWAYTLGRFIFVKPLGYGDFTVEAATMNFVRQRTTIPIPRVLGAIRYRGRRYAFMTRVAGKEIDYWEWKTYSDEIKESIISQLKDYISQLRSIGPPPQSPPLICNILGGPILDHRLCVGGPYGPYRDEEQMNLQLRQGFTVDEFAEIANGPKDLTEYIRECHNIRHPIVLTHNDIAMRNIMIDGDRVTGLIDWECAGWLPAHWEYIKAHWTEVDRDEWVGELHKFIPPFDKENKADQMVGWSRSWGPRLGL